MQRDKYIVDIIIIALSIAFDKNHILRAILKDMGIGGCYLKLISKYLSIRKQYIVCKNTPTDLVDVPSSTLKKSDLELCDFSNFVNDLPRVKKHGKSFLFADSFKFVGKVSSVAGKE